MSKDMLGRSEAVSAEAALDALQNLPMGKTGFDEVPIETAYGRITLADIESPEDMPGFSRSTMDGYAVKASDTFGSSETAPAYLVRRGEVRMGEVPSVAVGSGETAAIPTGGMLPEGADAVVMLENVQTTGEDMVEVLKSVAPRENVVSAGEDIRRGEIVIGKGHRLRPQDIGALAGLGIARVAVFKRPSVGIISTGDEIVSPESEPNCGEVRDINSFNLAGLIMDAGATPHKIGIFPDEYEVLKGVIIDAVASHDMVLVSGGSSVGSKDMVADIIEAIEPGGVLFHGVAVKPGKPLIGGFVKGKPMFGLPGHPAAVTVSFLKFIEPLLLKLGGYEGRGRYGTCETVGAKLTKNISSAPGREDHVRVSVRKEGEALYAEPVLGKSGLIRTLVKADGLVVIPAHAQGAAEGEDVEVRLFRSW